MRDGAISDDPAVQAQLDRLGQLSPGRDGLGLDRITRLLARLGNPETRLAPVFHVAGTNGKGSTCAFLRAMLEAQGYRVHVFTSPHLVRFNERIRIAGTLIDDEWLAALLGKVLDANHDIGASFFEVTVAVALLAFVAAPADAVIMEVGLGGRLDATNILPSAAACAITSLGIDHADFLLEPLDDAPAKPLVRIAWEKAGIVKAGCPLVTQSYAPDIEAVIAHLASAAGAPLFMRGDAWQVDIRGDRFHYRDANGGIILPLPPGEGGFQPDNAALAVAVLRHQAALPIRPEAMAEGIMTMRWPARLQTLPPGPLTARLPESRIILDGGHNADAARRLADWLGALPARPVPFPIVFGLMENKDLRAVLEAWRGLPLRIVAVPVPDKPCHDPTAIAAMATAYGFCATSATDIEEALDLLAPDCPEQILIAGSLYLAGDVLKRNLSLPD